MVYQVRESGVYTTKRYLSKERWFSYWYQINEIFKLRPKSILELGPGNGVVTDLVKKMGIAIKTFDNDPENHPDYLGDISRLKKYSVSKSDLIIACQIFEHISYHDFLNNIEALREYSNQYALISLPYTKKGTIKISISLILEPLIQKLSWIKILTYRPAVWKYNGIHHWEIGARGLTLKNVLTAITQRGWNILRHYPLRENPYHYFIICEKSRR